jgi:hypothetical protein
MPQRIPLVPTLCFKPAPSSIGSSRGHSHQKLVV